MAINVNRVAVNPSYAVGTDFYFRYAKVCPVGTGLPDGSSIICKAGGRAWFVAPKASEIICTRIGDPSCCFTCCCGYGAAINRAVQVTGVTGWFIPTLAQIINPGYCCRVNWTTTLAGITSTSDYNTCCVCDPGLGVYAASAYVGEACVANFRAPTNYCGINFSDGSQAGYDITDSVNYVFMRTFRCVTY